MQTLIEKAIKKRDPLKSKTNAIRLINGQGDRLEGLVLEQYHQHFVAQISDPKWLQPTEKKILIDIVKNKLKGKYFVVKDRTRSASASPEGINTEIWIDNEESFTVVHENGLQFYVELNDALNSGLFLDMRTNRKWVSDLSKDRKVLNCFSYTCSFGVYCRQAGAKSVVNVDTSKKILKHGLINYKLNEILPEKNEFIVSDVRLYLETAVKKNNSFDMIILDPPSFSRFGKKKFSVSEDLKGLIELAIKVLNPNGILFVATNFSRMSSNDIEEMIHFFAGSRRIKMVQPLGQDQDFTGSGLRPDSHLAAVIAKIE